MKQSRLLRCTGVSAVLSSLFLMCSAPEEGGRGGSMRPVDAFLEQEAGGESASVAPRPADTNGFVGGDDQIDLTPDGVVPFNIGTEELCDGLDENNNGIIDDVDRGNDGLCDCLNIAFLGKLASDAGRATGAFEAWLEARSEIPVKHISASEELTAAQLESTQVLVIGNMTERVGKPYSASELSVLEAFIKIRGGGVISLGGYTANENAMAPTVELLKFSGIGYDYKGRGAGVLGVGAPPVKITGIVMPEHPSMKDVDAVGVFLGYPIIGDGDVLIKQNDFILAMAKVLENGRIFGFADEWITQDRLWLPDTTPKALTQCQQGCIQCEMQCASCDTQCAACQLQPCQGGGNPDAAICVKGCDSACESCQSQCTQCESTCAACTVVAPVEPELDMAQFWLNVIGWLTPTNECKVKIPLNVRAK